MNLSSFANYILILFLENGYAGGATQVEFETLAACENFYETAAADFDTYAITARAVGFCIKRVPSE